MVEERQAWENKYKADTKKHSQEITELKFKLRAERIERAELQELNEQSCGQKIKRSKMSLELWNNLWRNTKTISLSSKRIVSGKL